MEERNGIKNCDSSIRIYLQGLTAKERATFNRVIAFNVRQGLQAIVSDSITDADILILSDECLSQVENVQSRNVVVVSDRADNTGGNFQLTRPLVITRVMNALSDAIKCVGEANLSPSTQNKSNTTQTKHDTESKPKSGHHALVIDDSAAIRKQLELELGDAGFTTDQADCGEKALEMIEQRHFDLIFLDIVMPGINGYDTCKRIRSIATYKKTPVIMLSGKTKPLDEVRGIIAGATTYLTKPVEHDKLQEALARVKKWIDNFSTGDAKGSRSAVA